MMFNAETLSSCFGQIYKSAASMAHSLLGYNVFIYLYYVRKSHFPALALAPFLRGTRSSHNFIRKRRYFDLLRVRGARDGEFMQKYVVGKLGVCARMFIRSLGHIGVATE